MEFLLAVTFVVLSMVVALHFGLHSRQRWMMETIEDLQRRVDEDYKSSTEALKELSKKQLVLELGLNALKNTDYPYNVKLKPASDTPVT